MDLAILLLWAEKGKRPMEALVSLAALTLLTSIVALIRPLPRLWLPNRKRAGLVAVASFVLMTGLSHFLPQPAVQEEPETVAVEEPKPAPVDPQEGWPWWRTVLPKDYQNDPDALQAVMACQTDDQCWGNWNKRWAIPACVEFINSFDDGVSGPPPDHMRMRSPDGTRKNGSTISLYIGAISSWCGTDTAT